MTVGYLLDLLIINEVRKEKIAHKMLKEVEDDLNRQNGHLLREIGKYLTEISTGSRPGTFAKHKDYDRDINELHEKNLIKVIHNLYLRHSELWVLEDIRRDKSNTDEARLIAADKVSVVNKKRNDLVEQVDRIISSDLKKFKAWGELIDYRDNQP